MPGNHDDPPDYTAQQMRLEERQLGAVSMLLVRQSCIAHYTSFFHGGHVSFRSEDERAYAIRRSLRINVTLSALRKWCEFRNTVYEDVLRNSDAPIVLSYESITTAPKLLDRVLSVLNVRSPRPPESSMVKMVKMVKSVKMHSAPLHEYIANWDEVKAFGPSRLDYHPHCSGSERLCLILDESQLAARESDAVSAATAAVLPAMPKFNPPKVEFRRQRRRRRSRRMRSR